MHGIIDDARLWLVCELSGVRRNARDRVVEASAGVERFGCRSGFGNSGDFERISQTPCNRLGVDLLVASIEGHGSSSHWSTVAIRLSTSFGVVGAAALGLQSHLLLYFVSNAELFNRVDPHVHFDPWRVAIVAIAIVLPCVGALVGLRFGRRKRLLACTLANLPPILVGWYAILLFARWSVTALFAAAVVVWAMRATLRSIASSWWRD